MAEPTLSLMWDDIRNSVYEEVFGGGTNGYTDDTEPNRLGLVERYCESGYRQFLMPPPVEGRVHDWSFLMPAATLLLNASYTTGTIAYDHTGGSSERLVTLTGGEWPSYSYDGSLPQSAAGGVLIDIAGTSYTIDQIVTSTTLTLPANDNPAADVDAATNYTMHQDDYDLPDDFGMLLGNFTFAQKDNVLTPCDVVGEARIRELRQRDYNSSSQDPVCAALRIKQTSSLRGDRWQVLFWPKVTAASTVTYRYRVTVDKPVSGEGSANDYVYGVSQYSETILYSCLAEAERRKDGERGPMWQHFMELLQTSVMRDRQDNTADLFGYNLDYSDRSEIYAPRRGTLWSDSVTHKGQGT
jgi:hypothetical protein